LLVFCLGWSGISAAVAGGPDWWQRQKVTVEGEGREDFGVLNQGQLKQIALAAFNEMQEVLPGGAGTELTEFISKWTRMSPGGVREAEATPGAEDFAVVNLGQLKEVAQRFYQRLVEVGIARSSPWGWVEPDDYALANVGQAKALFSFNPDPAADTDENGLRDLWERLHFHYTGVDPDADADGDGVSNFREFQAGTDPQDFYNGVSSILEAVSGDKQEALPGLPARDFLVVRVTTSSGAPIANAPVVFELLTGKSGGLFELRENEESGGTVFTARSDAEGMARVALRACVAADFTMLVKVSAGNSKPVLFRCKTQTATPGNGAEAKIHTPEFSVDGGDSRKSLSVVVSCGTPGAVVHFTKNGNDPTEEDPVVGGDGLVEVGEPLVLKARAFLSGVAPSEVRGASYRIGPQIWSARGHSLALDLEGTLWSWGFNGNGELGLGHEVSQTAPVPLQGLGEVVTAAAGGVHCLAVLRDGRVVAWGSNRDGQLGREEVVRSTVPVPVEGLPAVRAVAAGWAHCVALGADGSVWCWGRNITGQLGDGTKNSHSKPERVKGISGVCAIAAGNGFTLALCADGCIWAWGSGLLGQLGNGRMDGALLPVQVLGQGGFIAIAAGGEHTLGLRLDGTVWGWGYNSYAQLGNGFTSDSCVPVQVVGLSGRAISVAAGQMYSLALMADRTVMGWGSNERGELGDSSESFPAPARLSAFDGASGIAAGKWATVVFGKTSSEGGAGGSAKRSTSTKNAETEPAADKSAGTCFQLRLGIFSDWRTKEESYMMATSEEWFTDDIDPEDPSRTVRNFVAGIEYGSYEYQYSHFMPYGWSLDPTALRRPMYPQERLDAGGYLGEEATTMEEVAARSLFSIEGNVSLEVEITDPNPAKGTRKISLLSSFGREAFPERPVQDSSYRETLVDVSVGSTLRLKAPGLGSRVFGNYLGDERLDVRLTAYIPEEEVNSITQNYLLFKQDKNGKLEWIEKLQGAVLHFSAAEKVEYVLFPVVLTQSNYPTSSGSTDLGPAEMRTISSGTSTNSIAWIRGAAEMADLEIKLGDGRLAGLSVDWALDITTERPERKEKDDVHLPVSKVAKTVLLPATQAWKITEALQVAKKTVGGLCKVNYSIKDAAGQLVVPPRVFEFRIRGKNPRDAEVFEYMQNRPTEIRFAWAMVQHESRQSSAGVPRIFNHFNAGGSNKELPNFSGNAPTEDGWGIAQLDKPLGKSAVTEEVYNWQSNLQKFQGELDQKRKAAQNYIVALRKIYQPLGLWEELPETCIRDGTLTTLTTLETAIIQLYNGAAWLVEIKDGKIIYDAPYTADEFGGSRYISCWRFNSRNPAGRRWEFRPNKNNYVYKVIRDEWEGNLWYQE